MKISRVLGIVASLSVLLSFSCCASAETAIYSIARFEPGVFSSKWGEPEVVEVSISKSENGLLLSFPTTGWLQEVNTKNFAVTPAMRSMADLSKVTTSGGSAASLTVGEKWETEQTSPPSPASRCAYPIISKLVSEITAVEEDSVVVIQNGTWASSCGSGTGEARLVISKDRTKLISFKVSSFWGKRQVAGTEISLLK